MSANDTRVIAYDTSENMHDLSVICVECADRYGDGDGNLMYAGEEWGGPLPECSHCGCTIDGLVEVQS